VCRGLQVLNVAFGGTLYQDIGTQRPGARTHRDAGLYDQNFHPVDLVAGTRLSSLYPGVSRVTVNSVHHQGVKDLARDFVVEAVSSDDGIVEAFRWKGPSYVAAVQWHPEFHDWTRTDLLSGDPLLADFLQAARNCRRETARATT
jgi:putative glutamine amidotransferase